MRIDADITPEEPDRGHRPLPGVQRPQDPLHRAQLGPGRRRPGVHAGRPLHHPRVDGVDPGLPVRMRRAAVRHDRRQALPRARPQPHGGAHGAPRLPRGRPRPRLQQPLHLRQPAAADARGPHPPRPAGAAALRAGRQALRRRAGGALDAHGRRHRLHPLLQRPPLPVLRHDPHPAHPVPRRPPRPRPHGRGGPARQPPRPGRGARPDHGPLQRLLRGGPRRLGRERPRRPRVDLQHQRRPVPLRQHPAGVLAVHHLDPRPLVDPVRLRRAAGVLPHRAAGAARSPSG